MRARGDAILGTPLARNVSEHLRGENRGRTPSRLIYIKNPRNRA